MKMPNLTYDATFKLTFKSPKTLFYVKAILETILKEKVDISKIEYKDTEIITNAFTNEKGKISDCYIVYKNKYNIIFECNNYNYKDLINLKLRYIYAIYNNSYAKGKNENNNQVFILVNINNFNNQDEDKAIEEYYYRNEENGVLTKKIKVINISLVKIKEKWDNKVTLSKQEKLFLYLSVNHLKEEYVKKIIEGDEVLMTLREELRKLSNDEILETLFDKDEEDAMELAGIKAYEREQGEAKGVIKGKEEGLKEGKKSIIRNMLKLNMTKEDILKITGLKEKEYDKLMSI